MQVGKRELLSFAERHAGCRVANYSDLASGYVFCRLISTVFPNCQLTPAYAATASPSQQKHHNWSLISKTAATLGIPPQLLDRRAIETGNTKRCASALVLFYFLYQLCKDGDCSIQFTEQMTTDLTAFVQSPASVRALVLGGGMKIDAVPAHLHNAVLQDPVVATQPQHPQSEEVSMEHFTGALSPTSDEDDVDVPFSTPVYPAAARGGQARSAAHFASPQRDSPPVGHHQWPFPASLPPTVPPGAPASSTAPATAAEMDAKEALLQQVMEELESMHDELDRQIREKGSLREQLDEAIAEGDQMAHHIETIESSHAKLQQRLDATLQSRSAVEREMNSLEVALEQSTDEVSRLRAELSKQADQHAAEIRTLREASASAERREVESAAPSTDSCHVPFEMTSPSPPRRGASAAQQQQQTAGSAGRAPSASAASIASASPSPQPPAVHMLSAPRTSSAQRTFYAASNALQSAALAVSASREFREAVEASLFDMGACFTLLQERADRGEQAHREVSEALAAARAELLNARAEVANLKKELALQRTAAEHIGAAAAASEAACRERTSLADRERVRLERELSQQVESCNLDLAAVRDDAEAHAMVAMARIEKLQQSLQLRDELCLLLRRWQHQHSASCGAARATADLDEDIEDAWEQMQFDQQRANEAQDSETTAFKGAVALEFRGLLMRCVAERDRARTSCAEATSQSEELRSQLASYAVVVESERQLRKQYETELRAALEDRRQQALAMNASQAAAQLRESALKQEVAVLAQTRSEEALWHVRSSVSRSPPSQLYYSPQPPPLDA